MINSHHIVALSGKRRSGKDSVATAMIFQSKSPMFRFALADPLSDMVEVLLSSFQSNSWGDYTDSEKDSPFPGIGLTKRELMQYLGTDVFREAIFEKFPQFNPNPYGSIWVNALLNRLRECISRFGKDPLCMIVSDVRFLDEYESLRRFSSEIDYAFHSIRVERDIDRTTSSDTHKSEVGVEEIPFDIQVQNDGDLSDLTEKVKGIMKKIGLTFLGGN